jgi:ABC-2 type transport system ATP-binding protein
VLKADGVGVRHPSGRGVSDVSLRVGAGEVLGLVGPNGSGKTTLLRVLATLDAPTTGRVVWFGGLTDRRAPAVRGRLGCALDTPVHLDALTGEQNAELFAALYGVPRRQREERLPQLLAWAGLAGVWDRPVGEYSLGMRRRLSLVEALCHDPDLVLLDEPTLALDEEGEVDLERRLRELTQRGAGVLVATNDRGFAAGVCTGTVELAEGRAPAGTVPA